MPWSVRRCGPTPATGWKPSGCRSWTAAEVIARASRQTFGIEHLDAAVQAGRGFILALPHTGNYDVAGLWLIDRYHKPFTTVAERLRPAWLFDRFVAYRESIGMEVLALTGGDQTPTAVLTHG